MNNSDERDYAEEAANWELIRNPDPVPDVYDPPTFAEIPEGAWYRVRADSMRLLLVVGKDGQTEMQSDSGDTLAVIGLARAALDRLEASYRRYAEPAGASWPRAHCMGCRWASRVPAWAAAARGHERESGHRVTVWDTATSQLARDMWTEEPPPGVAGA